MINPQCNDMIKGKYQGKNIKEFHKCLSGDEYAQLKLHGIGLISVFGSTICMKTFSKMKYVKSHYRSALTNKHLQLVLMTGNTKFVPQLSSRPVLQKKKLFSIIILWVLSTKNCGNLIFMHLYNILDFASWHAKLNITIWSFITWVC